MYITAAAAVLAQSEKKTGSRRSSAKKEKTSRKIATENNIVCMHLGTHRIQPAMLTLP